MSSSGESPMEPMATKSSKLSQEEALKYLINGIAVAQKRGAYSLEEASQLYDAVKLFISPAVANGKHPA